MENGHKGNIMDKMTEISLRIRISLIDTNTPAFGRKETTNKRS